MKGTRVKKYIGEYLTGEIAGYLGPRARKFMIEGGYISKTGQVLFKPGPKSTNKIMDYINARSTHGCTSHQVSTILGYGPYTKLGLVDRESSSGSNYKICLWADPTWVKENISGIHIDSQNKVSVDEDRNVQFSEEPLALSEIQDSTLESLVEG